MTQAVEDKCHDIVQYIQDSFEGADMELEDVKQDLSSPSPSPSPSPYPQPSTLILTLTLPIALARALIRAVTRALSLNPESQALAQALT